MTTFLKGLDLCESFYNEVARPILHQNFPLLQYSAGLIGYGSDVIGLDDEMSTDHEWGPRLHLFLPEEDFDLWKGQISSMFSMNFPYQYHGYFTNFTPPDLNDHGVRRMVKVNDGPVNPHVQYHTLRSYFEDFMPLEDISIPKWLTFDEHGLLGITSGRVFHDDLGLNTIRQKLAYFPHDVWLWMMASQWTMIAEEEAFTGRCGSVGDDLGSRLVAARQVHRIMRLCFLMEKQYAPYSKWFGSAFNKLKIASVLSPILEKVLLAVLWKERDELLGHAYTIAADQHNSLGLTDFLSSNARDYFGRPFQVLFAERFSKALKNQIRNPGLKELIPAIGSVNQFTDSTAIYSDGKVCEKLRILYQ
jgi:hypothetical protein